VPDDFELLGVPHAAWARDLARARQDRPSPQHPDFAAGEIRPAFAARSGASDPEGADAAVDFARVESLVDRMRAAFFSGDA
jgi:hypothetical protein